MWQSAASLRLSHSICSCRCGSCPHSLLFSTEAQRRKRLSKPGWRFTPASMPCRHAERKHMNVAIAAMSAPAHMNGVSRHAANLARALLTATEISEVHFIAGAWQKEMFRSALGVCDSRLHTHWIPLRDANLSRLFWYYRELPCIAAQLEADIVHFTFPSPIPPASYACPTVLSLHDLYPFDIPRNFGRLKSALARHTVVQC